MSATRTYWLVLQGPDGPIIIDRECQNLDTVKATLSEGGQHAYASGLPLAGSLYTPDGERYGVSIDPSGAYRISPTPRLEPAPWQMPEAESRCPGCGRFIGLNGEGEFYDVEPGGCRGSAPVEAYCSEACADRCYREAHSSMEECTCEV